MILSGDVQENPGPVKNPCAICSRAVARNHRALPCKSCKKLCHIRSKCGNINPLLYLQMKNTDNIEWQCPICAKDEASIENRPLFPLHQDVALRLEENLDVYNDLKIKTQGYGITIAHLNIRSLLRNFNEVRLLLQNTNIDLLALTETHLHKEIPCSDIATEGYEIKRNDRKDRNGGGCAMYHKSSIEAVEIEKYKTEDIEALWIQVEVSSQKMLFGTVYRPPQQESFYNKFETVLEQIWQERRNIFITGDLNSDMTPNKMNDKGKRLARLLNSFNLKKHDKGSNKSN